MKFLSVWFLLLLSFICFSQDIQMIPQCSDYLVYADDVPNFDKLEVVQIDGDIKINVGIHVMSNASVSKAVEFTEKANDSLFVYDEIILRIKDVTVLPSYSTYPGVYDFDRDHGKDKQINLFFINDSTQYIAGVAEGIVGNTAVINLAYAHWKTVAHELGHLFGLRHTHDFPMCDDCDDCQDQICDTPYDPNLIGLVLIPSCKYVGDSEFNPDITNIMSYSPHECKESFTELQVKKMKENIVVYPVLLNTVFKKRKLENSVIERKRKCKLFNIFRK